eukprot:1325492-Amorphochlora_amoeboformis.AAC.1
MKALPSVFTWSRMLPCESLDVIINAPIVPATIVVFRFSTMDVDAVSPGFTVNMVYGVQPVSPHART